MKKIKEKPKCESCGRAVMLRKFRIAYDDFRKKAHYAYNKRYQMRTFGLTLCARCVKEKMECLLK